MERWIIFTTQFKITKYNFGTKYINYINSLTCNKLLKDEKKNFSIWSEYFHFRVFCWNDLELEINTGRRHVPMIERYHTEM